MNAGNIRWTENGIQFLDFEDTRHSWFPIRVDIVFVLERLALINENNDQKAFENARSILDGYVKNSNQTLFFMKGDLINTLEWLSMRSLCMLQKFEWEGFIWPESEWAKFDILLQHIEERYEVLQEIEACYIGR